MASNVEHSTDGTGGVYVLGASVVHAHRCTITHNVNGAGGIYMLPDSASMFRMTVSC